MRDDPLHPEALSFPRADLLMIVAPNKAAAVDVETAPGVSVRIPIDGYQQIVYGHARLGQYVPGGSGVYDFEEGLSAFVEMPEPSPIPAERWHLARRTVSLAGVAPPIIGGPVEFPDAQDAPPIAPPSSSSSKGSSAASGRRYNAPSPISTPPTSAGACCFSSDRWRSRWPGVTRSRRSAQVRTEIQRTCWNR